MLVEKAYAKLYGGYDMIVGGQELFCLQDLYGGLPSSYPYVFSLKRGNLIGLTNTTNHSVAMPLGLKAGHAYGLVKIVQLQVQGQLETVVQLRNVWSDASSDAVAAAAGVPWARGGADWKQCSLHQKQRVGYQLANDGTVWLTLATCLALFSTVLESRNVYQFPSVDPRDLDVAKDVIATGTFVSNRSCLVELSLPSEGTYAVIPATYAPFESAFQVVVASPVPLAVGFVSDDDIPVHFECWEAFQASAAPKCRHCREPILKIEPKFDGRFYDLNDGSGKVHFECWDAFRQ
ncbi:hypothetical protein DYB37_012823 [Aphanomyces astaci]|uniref:Calpain catalytic domain-containing protein n=1 Tax=Aphanomyces astaci TaxID=112090 RepID=A0A418FNU7_APHAT|nr:hypothetical protein DYB37_012823 [Aphanomyces astaci]